MEGIITGLVVIAMVMTPGVPGEVIYTEIVGDKWEEERINYVVRVILFGMIGLALTVMISSLVGGPTFGYVDRSFPSLSAFVPPAGWLLGIVYLGHLLISAVVGFAAGRIHLYIIEQGKGTIHDAWDDLIQTHAPNHWVVVVTTEGDVLAGMLETVDDHPNPKRRDIILEEPARYDENREGYFATKYQHLFLPWDLIESIAVVSNDDDQRLSEVNQKIL